MKKTPTPVDRHVAGRVREQRLLVGVSQEKLGEALGVTFQQVQKYEKGTNRIPSGRLREIATALGVELPFFYEGLPKSEETSVSGFAEESAAYVAEPDSSSEGRQLISAFARISHPHVRQRIVALVETLADTPPRALRRGRKPARRAE